MGRYPRSLRAWLGLLGSYTGARVHPEELSQALNSPGESSDRASVLLRAVQEVLNGCHSRRTQAPVDPESDPSQVKKRFPTLVHN